MPDESLWIIELAGIFTLVMFLYQKFGVAGSVWMGCDDCTQTGAETYGLAELQEVGSCPSEGTGII